MEAQRRKNRFVEKRKRGGVSGFSKINSGRLSAVVPCTLNKLYRFLVISASTCAWLCHSAYTREWFLEIDETCVTSLEGDILATQGVDYPCFRCEIKSLIIFIY